jgi:[glutamine synthetase] adenylyltransferase / [glutamine synthetase]-adenylyl-L-tyrosine phosphorylase
MARTLASYVAYWDRWAETWEFQALLKARAVAGDATLGMAFAREAAARVWDRPFGADELRQVRQLKARTEQAVNRQGLADRELKRGKGGIRDIEFAIQLLQLVHGRADPHLRSPSTVPALRALAAGGYIASEDAAALESAYGFLSIGCNCTRISRSTPFRPARPPWSGWPGCWATGIRRQKRPSASSKPI